ncbi:type 1 glutamine amidotransferase domain-containing protein [Streptomyces botrytidirepellens]|uniref:Type 1 glutamine amidotransferase n=1 Tax=Streptomyces botrytidirepellens TaxID=2486417 RepID=A0A3M8XAY5_9ACTN|nr:type 1 glutamine amidotransferase domain-containing protein [Streptomyces botrytidirepellens]RNG38669.1 type 1 glutamine amidotransferase [Streptomyces botrytidirepellens]
MKVAFLVAPEGVEQVELTDPWQAVRDAGGTPRLVSTASGRIQAFHHLDKADTFEVDQTVKDATVEEYDALVLPGGVANPDLLRLDKRAVAFVKGFVDAGKPVAAICHAPWTLVEADVVRGRTLTSWPSLRTDITNAGGVWVDEQVKVCEGGRGALITSRKPDDLKAFDEAFLEEFAKAAGPAGSARKGAA